MQTQAQELEAAHQQAAQAGARAAQVDRDLQEARRQTTVLAEDDQELRDKVRFEHRKTISVEAFRQAPPGCVNLNGIVQHSRQCSIFRGSGRNELVHSRWNTSISKALQAPQTYPVMYRCMR